MGPSDASCVSLIKQQVTDTADVLRKQKGIMGLAGFLKLLGICVPHTLPIGLAWFGTDVQGFPSAWWFFGARGERRAGITSLNPKPETLNPESKVFAQLVPTSTNQHCVSLSEGRCS